MQSLIHSYEDKILSITEEELTGGTCLPDCLRMGSENSLSVYYAPFDWVNTRAKVVIMGITPGKIQAVNALRAFKKARLSGLTVDDAHRIAKQTGAFSGAMRTNLVNLLDFIRMNEWLGIDSCSSLFGTQGQHNELIHSLSSLPFPVFKNSENYNGTPSIKSSSLLQEQLQQCANVLKLMPDATIIPLGPKVVEAMNLLIRNGTIKEGKVFSGLPHPSGANAERIKYFLGQKPRSDLSNKVNPDLLDSARKSISGKMDLLLT